MTAPKANGRSDWPGTPDSGALVARIRLGDAEAFRRLFDAFYEPLHRYAHHMLRSREEAEDVVHDVFLRVWDQRERLDPACNVRAYLHAAARNRALDCLRRRRLEQRWRRDDPPSPDEERGTVDAGGEGDAESAIEAGEVTEAIRRAVEALPPRQRQVIVLRWRRQMSYAEIAAELQIAEKTVGIHMTRALQRLRGVLSSLLG
jgi:RNA polymerase sigma-70 factor (ECF subfamily)